MNTFTKMRKICKQLTIMFIDPIIFVFILKRFIHVSQSMFKQDNIKISHSILNLHL